MRGWGCVERDRDRDREREREKLTNINSETVYNQVETDMD